MTDTHTHFWGSYLSLFDSYLTWILYLSHFKTINNHPVDRFLLFKSFPSAATLAKHVPKSILLISINVVIIIPFLGSLDLLQYLHIGRSWLSRNNEPLTSAPRKVGEDLFPLVGVYGGINGMSYNYQWKWQAGSPVLRWLWHHPSWTDSLPLMGPWEIELPFSLLQPLLKLLFHSF